MVLGLREGAGGVYPAMEEAEAPTPKAAPAPKIAETAAEEEEDTMSYFAKLAADD